MHWACIVLRADGQATKLKDIFHFKLSASSTRLVCNTRFSSLSFCNLSQPQLLVKILIRVVDELLRKKL